MDIEPASDDVPELRWDTVTARVGLATATGTQQFTVAAKYGLALAAGALEEVAPDEVGADGPLALLLQAARARSIAMARTFLIQVKL